MKPPIPAFAFLFFLAGSFSISHATTWHIKPDGTGDAPTIQAGVDSAASGDTVLLASGTFTGNGNRDISFNGKAITVRSKAGDPELCVIDCQGGEGDNHRGFSFGSGEGLGSVLEGLTITGGWVWSGETSGGIICSSSSPTISHCIITGNWSAIAGGIGCYSSSPSILHCAFVNNGCQYDGAGLYCSSSSPIVTDCSFINNSSQTSGGGISCEDGSSPLINGCVFANNRAVGWAGGGIACWASSPSIVNCTFFGNEGLWGGGVYCSNSFPILENTIIVFSALGSTGLHCDSGNPTVSCCDIYGNEGGDVLCGIDGGGNFSADPRFCGVLGSDNYHLQSVSPCAPGNHPLGDACGLIGALPVGCGSVATVEKTWGEIKATYHD